MYTIDLADQVAVVTGGVSGIGRAIVERLVQAGAHVVIADVLERADERVLDLLESTDGQSCYVQVDLSDHERRTRVLTDVVAEHGRLDVLVANAAIVGAEGLWDEAFEINTRGVYELAEAARPHLAATQGRICVLGSASVYSGGTGIPEYITTKAGAMALIRFMARRYAGDVIRVNGLAPAIILTDMLLSRFGSQEAVLDHYRDQLPLGRLGTPGDVADAAMFTVSDMSRWMTGETLLLDGGRLYLN